MDSTSSSDGQSSDADANTQPFRADQILAMIDACLSAGHLDRAFSGYLLLLGKGVFKPEVRASIAADFTAVLQRWAELQERAGRTEEALWSYEAALSVLPENADVRSAMGCYLHRLGRVKEAVLCFRHALELDPDCTSAQESLANAVSSPFGGWHFRMLNDKRRNTGYQTAIAKAIAQGHDAVLDIGSGTGLLSMFAANAGAKSVYACEETREMVELSHDVLAANQMQDRIRLLHKLSTDMSVPEDLPKRVSLVVTEIFDAGLFGEGAVGTLQHAWKNLLLPPKISESQIDGSYGQVIPARAVVYAQAIQCPYIRKHYRLLDDKLCNLDVSCLRDMTPVASHGCPADYQGEPYNSERMYEVPFGYQPLTSALKVLEVDFNDPEIIRADHPTADWKAVDFQVIGDGQVDAVISWFDLWLDKDIVLSSSPTAGSCWEQAVFPTEITTNGSEGKGNGRSGLFVREQDTLTVGVSCHGDCLHLRCLGITHNASAEMAPVAGVADPSHEAQVETVRARFEERFTTGDSSSSVRQDRKIEPSVAAGDETAPPVCPAMDPDTVAMVNDLKLNSALYHSIAALLPKSVATGDVCNKTPDSQTHPQTASVNSARIPRETRFSVADLSPSLPVAGLFAAKISPATRVTLTTGHSQARALVRAVARANELEGCLDLGAESESNPLSPSSGAEWDVLVADLVAPTGILRERILEDIAVARVCALRPAGRVIPSTVSVFAMCIECAGLQGDSEVLGTGATNGLKVAEHFNQHKVSTFLDLHLSTRVYKQLSPPLLALRLDLNEPLQPDSGELPSFVRQERTSEFEASDEGRITAVPYWYDIGLDAANHVNTLDGETHWRQAAHLLSQPLEVEKGQRVRVRARIEESSFRFDVEVLRLT